MPKSIQTALLVTCSVLLSGRLLAAELLADFPADIHPGEHYVFYSHGLIVEGSDPRPVHPSFGVYEFPEIAQALFDGGDFNLIAHHRPAQTDPVAYAAQLVGWVRTLVDAGVPPGNIALVGFSRGAQITLLAASQVPELGINTAVMGVCRKRDYVADPPIQLSGHVLSIYEMSDYLGSCDKLLKRSAGAASIREIAIATGLGHGAFYAPRADWLTPLKAWLGRLGHGATPRND